MKCYCVNPSLIFLAVVIAASAGCGGTTRSPTMDAVAAPSASTAASHSLSDTTSGRDLLGINSVYIAAPQISRDASVEIGDIGKLSSLIRQAWSSESSISVVQPKAAPSSQSLCEGARITHADGCLVVTIVDYHDRNMLTQGASGLEHSHVSFTVELVRVSDKSVIYQQTFSFKDQALTDNLLTAGDAIDMKGGTEFATASSILTKGLKNTFRTLDASRTKQFLVK